MTACDLLPFRVFATSEPSEDTRRILIDSEFRNLPKSANSIKKLVLYHGDKCDPNLAVYGVWINNLDPRLPRIALFASRDIARGEELTFDYLMTGDQVETTDDILLTEVTDKSTLKHETEDCKVAETHDNQMMAQPLSDIMLSLDATSESTNKITNDTETATKEDDHQKNVSDATGINCSCDIKALKESLPSTINDAVSDVIESARIPAVEEGSELGECTSSSLVNSVNEEEYQKTDGNSVKDSGEEEVALFFHRSKFSSPPIKYRLKCQCGAKKCRKFLY